MDQDTPRFTIEGGGADERRKAIRIVVAVVIAFIILGFGSSLLGIYTDWLWYTHDAQQPEVYQRIVSSRVTMWIIGFGVAFGLLFWNIRQATGTVLVYSEAPQNPQERLANEALNMIERYGKPIGALISFFIALGFAAYLGSRYQQYWFFTNSTEFGMTDPVWGLDVGFYVFQLPFLGSITGFLSGLLFIALLLAGGIYFAIRSLAQVANIEIGQPAVRAHLSILGGLFIIVFGLGMLLWPYEALNEYGSQFTGPGYTETQVLTLYFVMAGLAILVGIATMLNAKLWKPYRVPAYGVGGLFVLGIIALGLYPAALNNFVVEPNLLEYETPYAERAITMTRYAYGIDDFEVRNTETVRKAPTMAAISDASETLRNMRLWDPNVLQDGISNLQELKPYYNFSDVDIDRYDIDGEQQVVMLSPRDIQPSGLTQESQNWVSTRLVYTHGFGITMNPVNDAQATGRPLFFVRDMPPQSRMDAPEIEQPRIYFSAYEPGSRTRESYIVLKTNEREFDYPADVSAAQEDVFHRWEGERGVPVGGFLSRLAYSLHFSDFPLLVSQAVTDESLLLYRRDIRDRAEKVYPMLSFDRDPYIVVRDGQINWILDAYTTTDTIPYSRQAAGPQGVVNYIRNSVKIVVNAYTGDMTAYAFENDPILETIRKIFPDLIKPREEFPEHLLEHIRYAEDGFVHQSNALTQYHVTDPRRFLTDEDAWQIPIERGRGGGGEPIQPYYTQLRIPGGDRDGFVLIMPFTPRDRNNMIGWMAAQCDPENYGEVVLFKFPRNSQTLGPNQIEAVFDQDPVIADINRQFNNDNSEIVPGNLLIVPIGQSVLYVKPLFLQSRTANVRPVPELRKVILATQDEVVVGDTYEEALNLLFGADFGVETNIDETEIGAQAPDSVGETEEPEVIDPPAGEPIDSELVTPDADTGVVPRAELRRVADLLEQADEALRNGDFARYGELQDRAQTALEGLLEPEEIGEPSPEEIPGDEPVPVP